jgi:hypothetical protein
MTRVDRRGLQDVFLGRYSGDKLLYAAPSPLLCIATIASSPTHLGEEVDGEDHEGAHAGGHADNIMIMTHLLYAAPSHLAANKSSLPR